MQFEFNRWRRGVVRRRAPLAGTGLQALPHERLRQWLADRRRGGRLPRTIRRVAAAMLVVIAGVLAVTPTDTAAGEPVVGVAADLPIGTRLQESDLQIISVLRVPDGVLRDPAQAVGRALTTAVRRGEILTDARLADIAGPAPSPGRIAVPIRPADAAIVALLSAGMHVAVLAVGEDGTAVVLAPDAVVLVAGQATERGVAAPPIVVSVPVEAADRLVAATVVGTIALRFT